MSSGTGKRIWVFPLLPTPLPLPIPPAEGPTGGRATAVAARPRRAVMANCIVMVDLDLNERDSARMKGEEDWTSKEGKA